MRINWNKYIFLVCMIGLIVIDFYKPNLLGDSNSFLKGFLNSGLLSFLGIIVTATMASLFVLYFEFSKIEHSLNKNIFCKTYKCLRLSAYSLILVLFISIVLSVLKPIILINVNSIEFVSAIFNSLALLCILFNILIIVDLIQTSFIFYDKTK